MVTITQDIVYIPPSTIESSQPRPLNACELEQSTTLSCASIPPHPTEGHLRKSFVETTCGRKKANGKTYSSLFFIDHYINRAQNSFLIHDELDLALLGCIMCTVIVDKVRDG